MLSETRKKYFTELRQIFQGLIHHFNFPLLPRPITLLEKKMTHTHLNDAQNVRRGNFNILYFTLSFVTLTLTSIYLYIIALTTTQVRLKPLTVSTYYTNTLATFQAVKGIENKTHCSV